MSFTVISGYGSPSIDTNGLDATKFPFFRKPLDIDEILDTIESFASSKNDPHDDEGRKWPTRY